MKSNKEENYLPPYTELDDVKELMDEMFNKFKSFNQSVRNFLKKAHGDKNNDVRYINESLTRLEKMKSSIVDELDSKISGAITYKEYRNKLSFRLRLFCYMHRVFMSKDSAVGRIYKERFNSNQNNRANINNVRDTQYVAWALLREPQKDVIGELIKIMKDVYNDPRPDGNDTEEDFQAFTAGIVGHAGVHALYVEEGYYMSAPPEPLLDAEHGVDLIAINQKGFLETVEKLDLSKEEKDLLLNNVGSYDTFNNAWFQYVREYAEDLAGFITLIQVKCHRRNLFNDNSNITLHDNTELKDSLRITPDMVANLSLKDALNCKTPIKVEDIDVSCELISDTVSTFFKMNQVLPGAEMAFVDINIDSAYRLIARRS